MDIAPTSRASPALEIRGLRKSFTRPAVDGLDLCVHAGEFYMLYPDIWEDQLGLDWNDNLCIGCLEARIGRPVTFADIISIPNYSWMQPSSDRLLDRLGFKKCNGKWRHKSEKPKRRKSRGIVASLTATKAGKVKLRHTFV